MLDLGGFATTGKKRTDAYLMQSHAGYGSSAANIPYFTNTTIVNYDGVLRVENSTVFGCSFTAIVPCYVRMTLSFENQAGISLNSTTLSSTVSGLAQTVLVNYGQINNTNGVPPAHAYIPLKKGDVIRPHTNGNTPATLAACILTIVAREI